ncbi:hypothetical protein [Sphingomonas endolithica]|uniref:hypothetical protein n=1 Tax=Sphingomonas endolithica TaxID=2972485 RepID=UPI0021AF04F8|nr:hypothetical protein [Sphingomonas sp. ZFBP2030]
MIETLGELPALSASWLAPLEAADPDLYAELAESIVIELSRDRFSEPLPADAAAVLSTVDLRGKEIGAFRFAPAAGTTPAEQIAHYDRAIRQRFEASDDILFIGDYGAGSIFVSPQGVGLLDPTDDPPGIIALAATFYSFVLAQANAYDAYKMFIVKNDDIGAYRSAPTACSQLPALADADVGLIFDAQLKA